MFYYNVIIFTGPKGEPGIPGDAIKGQKGEPGNDGAPGLSGLPGIKGERGTVIFYGLLMFLLFVSFKSASLICYVSVQRNKKK